MTTTTTNSNDHIPSAFFTQILLQSGRYSSSNNIQQPPTLQADAEKLLVNFASLFAQELVAKSSSVAQRRVQSFTSININDVNFVLKNQWPVYDTSSYNQIP